MPCRIASVVEGHGEREAVPILIRRLIADMNPPLAVDVARPIRVPRGRLLRSGELERAVQLAALDARPGGAVMVVLDAEDDCPKTSAPDLLHRARGAAGDLPVCLVLARREFEAWFLAAAESLRDRRGLSTELEPPPDPEAVRGAKEWLQRHMPPARRYSETLDQPALAAVFDLELARRRSPSFEKLCREMARLFVQLGNAAHE